MYTLLTQHFTVSLLVWSFCKLIDDVIYLRENTYCSVLLICILIKLSNLLIMYNNKVEQTSIWAFVSINSNQVLIMVNEHLRMDNNIQMERVAITQRTRRRFSDGWNPLWGGTLPIVCASTADQISTHIDNAWDIIDIFGLSILH